MEWSKHNIIGKLEDTDEWFIVNPLSRQADILDAATAASINMGKYENKEELIAKGYLVDQTEELKRFRNGYLDFIDNRDDDEIQIFFVPSYVCNFNCTYCYQEEYVKEPGVISDEIINHFFDYIKQEFAGRKKYVTVFGGEPLMPGIKSKQTIQKIIKRANKDSLELAFVTNGFALEEYIPILNEGKIREVQVTLDGTADVHDLRRPLHSGKGTFSQIATGIDLALEKSLPINLRTVMDRENIDNFVELAEFAVSKGWTKNPLFKTQIGRNYELHSCQSDNTKLFTRVDLYQALYHLIKKHPAVLEYHKPAFSISKFLFERGEMPDPLYDSCPGCKTEWAFDASGKIFSCTATVGKVGEELGTFYPTVSKKQDLIDEWQSRDVTSIEKCKDCSVQLACGGGCASVAKNQAGTICSPDCRPVKELLGLGLSLYFHQNETK